MSDDHIFDEYEFDEVEPEPTDDEKRALAEKQKRFNEHAKRLARLLEQMEPLK